MSKDKTDSNNNNNSNHSNSNNNNGNNHNVEIKQLKLKISQLEDDLKMKNAELLRYRHEIVKANQSLEAVMGNLSQELHSAQALQKILTPTTLPNISGFEWSTKFSPGTKFGGDYFDIFEHEDKLKFGILMSSASGYSMSSLLMSVVIKLSSQIEARKGLPANEVLLKIITEVAPQLSAKDSASLFYGVVDRRTFDMQYCKIGDIQGVIQNFGKEVLHELKGAENKLSKGFNDSLRLYDLNLNPRDRLIITSPGMVTVENSDGLKWGQNSLFSAIRGAPKQGVHELRNEIYFQCEKFLNKAPSIKDQTVIVMEVKEKVLKLARNK